MRSNLDELPLGNQIPHRARVLWVASTGGHLSQLVRIADASQASSDSVWVTFDTPQSRGLLEGRHTHYVDYVAPRKAKDALDVALNVRSSLDIRTFDLCVSTGATIAATILPMVAAHGIRTIYLESVSRTDGPSLTGKILQRVPRIEKYTQHKTWASRKWPFGGSVLDTWTPMEIAIPARVERRIFVTLGTIRPYKFDRLVDAVLKISGPNDEIVWQTGCTSRSDLPGVSFSEASTEEMSKHAGAADVVVSHAGVGSILSFLDSGIVPVLGVRRKNHGEHVDDHQLQIAREMVSRGLAVELDLEDPSSESFEKAERLRAVEAIR